MENIIGYVNRHGNKNFTEMPFCEVDSLVLSQFSYLMLDKAFGKFIGLPQSGKTIKQLVLDGDIAAFLDHVRDEKSNCDLLNSMAASIRFSDVEIRYYVNHIDIKSEIQFSAMTFFLGDGHIYIAFRGTDDSFIGWKEDMQLAFMPKIPAQVAAADYLNRVAAITSEKIILGGHSKGGNLAIYAAANCSDNFNSYIKKRIEMVYDHDGPGFLKSFFETDGYKAIEHKIFKTVPKSSLVGMILESHVKYMIVESERMGIMQHDPFSWRCDGYEFVYFDRLSLPAQRINSVINEWLENLNEEQRRKFVDALYTIMCNTTVTNFADLKSNWKNILPVFLKSTSELDDDTKLFLQKTMLEFIGVMTQDFAPKIKGIKK